MCLYLKSFDEDYEKRMVTKTTEYDSEVLIVSFKVVSKDTGLTYDVYAVRGDRFLIFFNGSFNWFSMSYFRPVEKTEQELYNESVVDSRKMFKSQQKLKERVMNP